MSNGHQIMKGVIFNHAYEYMSEIILIWLVYIVVL